MAPVAEVMQDVREAAGAVEEITVAEDQQGVPAVLGVQKAAA